MRNYNNCQMWNIRRSTFDDIHKALEHDLCCSNKEIIILLLYLNIEANRIFTCGYMPLIFIKGANKLFN